MSASILPARFEAIGGGYAVHVTVPWKMLEMKAPRKGDSLVFNVVVFDADGINPDHKTEWPWAGGPEYTYEDPAGWGELLFK